VCLNSENEIIFQHSGYLKPKELKLILAKLKNKIVYFWEMSNSQMKHYDYILPAQDYRLMTVYKMVQSGSFTDKSILLLDENTKKTKRCWKKLFQKKMGSALFANENFQDLDLQPYHYNMVKGLDFLQVFDLLSKQENITFINQKVKSKNRNYNFGTNGKRILFVL
jgi:hypothetical protein